VTAAGKRCGSRALCSRGKAGILTLLGWPYWTDVLRRIAAIAHGDTTALETLLLDRWLAKHPMHRLEQREEESCEA